MHLHVAGKRKKTCFLQPAFRQTDTGIAQVRRAFAHKIKNEQKQEDLLVRARESFAKREIEPPKTLDRSACMQEKRNDLAGQFLYGIRRT